MSLFCPSSSEIFHLGFPMGQSHSPLKADGCGNRKTQQLPSGPVLHLSPPLLRNS